MLPRPTQTADSHARPTAPVEAPGERETLVLNPADPLPSARAFTEAEHSIGGVLAIRHQAGQFFVFHGSAYRECDEASVRSDLYEFLEQTHRVKDGRRLPFQPTRAKVNDVLDALRAIPNLPVASAAPCWLGDDSPFDPFEVVPCTNGLLHIPSRALLPSTPAFFSVNGLDFAFDREAPRPVHWLQFLDDLWPGDPESVETLQEWFGYMLTPDTRQQKILMLIGPKRSGKGTIARVGRRLLGERNACAPTLANLGEQFGRAVLIGKTAAIIADARISGRTDSAVVAEALLSISGEDPQTIPRKFLPDWTGRLPTRFMLLTNELPRIEDASGALASRFLVLHLTRSFYGQEDPDLLARFTPELPAILAWALDGRDRLYARGRFVQPDTAADVIRQFEELGSPIGAFVTERCEVGQGFEVATHDIFNDWQRWCHDNGREKAGTTQTFGRNLRAAVPWLGETFPRVDGRRVRFYQGIRLNGGRE